jgi:hypothetical protein
MSPTRTASRTVSTDFCSSLSVFGSTDLYNCSVFSSTAPRPCASWSTFRCTMVPVRPAVGAVAGWLLLQGRGRCIVQPARAGPSRRLQGYLVAAAGGPWKKVTACTPGCFKPSKPPSAAAGKQCS